MLIFAVMHKFEGVTHRAERALCPLSNAYHPERWTLPGDRH